MGGPERAPQAPQALEAPGRLTLDRQFLVVLLPANLLGALVSFTYFTFIDSMPPTSSPTWRMSPTSIFPFP